MDPLSAVLLGAAVGLATGLVPGLHVNTMAALALAMAPALDAGAVLLLVAVGTVHTIVNILPSTYLGAPDEDDVLTVLPAHRLLLAGRGPEAVQVSVQASLGALMAAVAAAPLYAWLLTGPADLLALLDRGMPWIIAGTILLLVAQERHRGGRAMAWATLVLGASGALGLVAFPMPMRGVVPGVAGPLLPLLSGLFGAAGLVVALRRPPAIPRQRAAPGRAHAVPVAEGVVASGATAVLPGLTAAVATSLLPRARGLDPLRALAALSAVNTAHAVLALQVLAITGRVRTGLADVVLRGPELPASHVLLAVLAAGALGTLGTLAIDRLASRRVHQLPGRVLPAAGLAILVVLVALMTGAMGLLLFGAAACLGLVPLAAGVRRVHLVGCLLVPVLLRSLGFA